MDGQHWHTEVTERMMWSGKGNNPYTKIGQPFDQAFYIILNVAVGGQFFGNGPYVGGDEAKILWEKNTMEIDFIKVYEWK